jgi:ribosomal-protein-alanine N-acetyltransferase
MADRLMFVVEPMAVADLPQVMAIERLSFSAPWSERAYRYEIERNDHSVMLVVRSRRVAGPGGAEGLLRRLHLVRSSLPPVLGYGGLWLLVDEAHISTLAVHPEWRGHGLGELLLLSLLDWGARMGAQSATLEVRVSNHIAQGLYEKYWFDVAGRQPRYYSDNNEDAYIMVTPPFSTPEFQELLARNRAQLYARLGAHVTVTERPAGQNGQGSVQ